MRWSSRPLRATRPVLPRPRSSEDRSREVSSNSHWFLVTCERVQEVRGTHLPMANHRRRCISVLDKNHWIAHHRFEFCQIDRTMTRQRVSRKALFRNHQSVEVLFWKKPVPSLLDPGSFHTRSQLVLHSVTRQCNWYFAFIAVCLRRISQFVECRLQFIARVEHTLHMLLKLLLCSTCSEARCTTAVLRNFPLPVLVPSSTGAASSVRSLGGEHQKQI